MRKHIENTMTMSTRLSCQNMNYDHLADCEKVQKQPYGSHHFCIMDCHHEARFSLSLYKFTSTKLRGATPLSFHLMKSTSLQKVQTYFRINLRMDTKFSKTLDMKCKSWNLIYLHQCNQLSPQNFDIVTTSEVCDRRPIDHNQATESVRVTPIKIGFSPIMQSASMCCYPHFHVTWIRTWDKHSILNKSI